MLIDKFKHNLMHKVEDQRIISEQSNEQNKVEKPRMTFAKLMKQV